MQDAKYVRVLTELDVEQIAEVYKAHEGNLFEATLVSLAMGYGEYLSSIATALTKMQLSGSVVLGVFDGMALLGCCNVQLMYDTYVGYTNRPYAHLETGIFKPEYEGLGYNTLLLDAVKEYLVAKNCIFVMVNTSSAYAKRSLEKNGFVQESTRYTYTF